MPAAWHPKRWWNFCMSEDQKKDIETIFTEYCLEHIQYGSIEIFCYKDMI